MELEDYLKEDYETFEEEPEQANEAPIYQNATMIETIRSNNTVILKSAQLKTILSFFLN